jgi:hypothetical protein
MHWWDWIGVITGVVGLVLAVWTNWREQQARTQLAAKEKELDEALSSLKRAREFMSN